MTLLANERIRKSLAAVLNKKLLVEIRRSVDRLADAEGLILAASRL